MTESLYSFSKLFQINSQALTECQNSIVDSPIELETGSRQFLKANGEIEIKLRPRGNIEVSQLCSSNSSSSGVDKKSSLASVLEDLNLKSEFISVDLSPCEVYVFKYLNEEAKSTFSLSLGTVHLAFTIFLQYGKLNKAGDIGLGAVSSLLIASKLKDVGYNIPGIDELIDHSSKSIFLQTNKAAMSFESIKAMEIKISGALQWDLMLNTVLEALYFKAKNKEFGRFRYLVEKTILTHAQYSLSTQKSHLFKIELSKTEPKITNENSRIERKSSIEVVSSLKIAPKRSVFELEIEGGTNKQCPTYRESTKNLDLLKVPKNKRKSRKKKGKKSKSKGIFKLEFLNRSLKSILSSFEASDSESSQGNTSCTLGSDIDVSFSSDPNCSFKTSDN